MAIGIVTGGAGPKASAPAAGGQEGKTASLKPAEMKRDTFLPEDLPARIKAAFDKRAGAQRIIFSRQIQLYVGWNPKTDVAYQQALKDRTAADHEISRYRAIAPGLVKAEERSRSWGSFFGRLWEGFKSLWHIGPMGLPIPFFKMEKPGVKLA
ncbi:MAG: hypothetical protein FJZ01_05010 [Candidatus Sericytochromatia bacterium]|nr:hypothetical protein [Candidatus Tanganyikabacteria bacterium]